jgi:hypothetical protein
VSNKFLSDASPEINGRRDFISFFLGFESNANGPWINGWRGTEVGGVSMLAPYIS